MLRYKIIPKETFIVRNRISDCSEAAVQSYPFSNISPENTGC